MAPETEMTGDWERVECRVVPDEETGYAGDGETWALDDEPFHVATLTESDIAMLDMASTEAVLYVSDYSACDDEGD